MSALPKRTRSANFSCSAWARMPRTSPWHRSSTMPWELERRDKKLFAIACKLDDPDEYKIVTADPILPRLPKDHSVKVAQALLLVTPPASGEQQQPCPRRCWGTEFALFVAASPKCLFIGKTRKPRFIQDVLFFFGLKQQRRLNRSLTVLP